MISIFEMWISLKYLFPKTREKFFSVVTLFSFLGISLGVATLIIVMSVMNGFREELTSKILGINGHLKIKSTFTGGLKNDSELQSKIVETNKSLKIHKVVSSQGLLSFKKYSSGVLIKGVTENFFLERNILTKSISSEFINDFKNNSGIFVGEKLKKKLGLNIGDYLTILSSKNYETLFGNLPRSANFKVVGFFDVGMYEYDMSLIFMPINLLQNFLNNTERIDHYEIIVDNFREVELIKENLRQTIPDYLKIVDWRELNPSLFNAIEVERNVMFLILLLIIIVAAFNLISSMMILVSNKKKDIGVLRVLGISKFQLLRIFILNGFLIGFLGTILGVLLGLSFCFNINEIKSFIEFFTGSSLFSEEIYFFSNLPIIINTSQIIKICSISLFLSLAATIYPSIKATKVEPINLIKWD